MTEADSTGRFLIARRLDSHLPKEHVYAGVHLRQHCSMSGPSGKPNQASKPYGGYKPNPPPVLQARLGYALGVVMWLWVFHRARHDLPHMLVRAFVYHFFFVSLSLLEYLTTSAIQRAFVACSCLLWKRCLTQV